MQLNKIFKGLIIALPLVTLMACESGPTEAEKQAEMNKIAEQAEADRLAEEARTATVQAGVLKSQAMAEEEKMKSELNALQGKQTVHFDFDRATVSSQYYALLDQHAAFLRKTPSQSIVIEGHCDSRGTPEYNIALGERRAQSVETYLQNAGVSAAQISVVSYGEEKPINKYSSEAAFAENRRGVLVYQ